MMVSKLKRASYLALLLSVAVSVSGQTQTALSPKAYTLQECIKTALERNYQVRSAYNSLEAARGEMWGAWGALLPSISSNLDYYESWAGVPRINPYTGLPYSKKSTYYSANLSFNQVLFNGGYNWFNIAYQKNSKRSAEHSFRYTEQNLVLEVKQKYFALLKTKMLLEIQKDAVKRGEEQLKIAESRYELGAASLSDVLKAKVSYGNDKLELLNAENNYKLAQSDLNYVLNQEVSTPIEVVETLTSPEVTYTYEGALGIALENNPSYRKAEYDLAGAKNLFWMAHSSWWPTLSWGVSHSADAATSSELFKFKQENATYTVYARLSFSIFENFQRKTNASEAKFNLRSQKENLENTKNAVALEIRQAFLNIEVAGEKLKLMAESVASAEEDLNLAKEKYNLGAATILELLDAEVSYKQATSGQVEALFDHNLAVSTLEKAIGKETLQ
jgi:outer membrane protein TolC